EASRSADESRERLVRLSVANGARSMNEGDLPIALLWFVNALNLEQNDPEHQRPHRLRCASVLQDCPKLLQVLPHRGKVEYAEFSPDGRRILTTSGSGSGEKLGDGVAFIWDVATGALLTGPLEHSNTVAHARFSPDGRWVVTASLDGTARV